MPAEAELAGGTSVSDRTSLAHGSFALLRRDLTLWALKIVSSVVVARLLGPAAMGLWIILAMIPSYAEAIGRLKLDIGAVYFLGRGRYSLGKVSFVLNVVALLSSGVLILLALWQMDALRGYLLKDIPGTGWLLYGVLLSVPIHFAYLNYGYLLIALEDVRSYNRMISLREVLASGLPILLIGLFGWGVGGLVVGTLLGGLAGLAYGAARIERIERMSFGFDWTMIKDLLGYSWNLYVMGLLGHLNVYVAGLLVAVYLRPEQVAFFRMGQDHAQLLNKIPAALGTLLYPRIAKLGIGNRDAGELAARGSRISLLLMVGCGAIAVLAVRPVVAVVYGERYTPLALSFVTVMPGVVLSGVATILGQYFMGIGRPGILLAIASAGLLLQIGLSVLLMPVLGFVGAAVAASVTWVLIGVATAAVFVRSAGVPLREALVATKADVSLVADMLRWQAGRLGSGWGRGPAPSG